MLRRASKLIDANDLSFQSSAERRIHYNDNAMVAGTHWEGVALFPAQGAMECALIDSPLKEGPHILRYTVQ